MAGIDIRIEKFLKKHQVAWNQGLMAAAPAARSSGGPLAGFFHCAPDGPVAR